MIFQPLGVDGAYLVEPERIEDARGFFARTWCEREFAERGLNPCVKQCNLSLSLKRGTLRGLHFQAAPYEEAKLVRCVRGAIYDVVLDLRRASPTFLRHAALILRAQDYRAVYVPEGVAHGFQTLVEECEVAYQMSAAYAPECARGVRWNDPAFGIEWPIAEPVLSSRDRAFPDFIP